MKSIINCATGEITKIDLDKVSKDQQKIDEADFNAAKAIRQAEAEAKAAAKASGESKLAALGLSAAENAALTK